MVKYLRESDITGNIGRDKFIKYIDETIRTAQAIIDACEDAKMATRSKNNFNKNYEEDYVECSDYDSYDEPTPVNVAYTTWCESGMCAMSLMNILDYLGLDSERLRPFI